jgi:hypothetical protein
VVQVSTAINIDISISLHPPPNLDEVIGKFNQLATAIQSIRGVQIPTEVTTSLREMQQSAVDVSRAFRGITLEEFARQIPRIEGLEDVTKRQAEALARLYIQNQLAGGSIEDFKQKVVEMHEQLDLTQERAVAYANALAKSVPYVRLAGVSSKELVEIFGGTNAILQTTMTRFSQLPETITLPKEAIAELAQAALEFQQKGEPALEKAWETIDRVAEKTGRDVVELQDAFVAINNAMSQTPRLADAFAAGLAQVQSQLSRASPEFVRYRSYVQEFHATIGPFGFAMMRIGYQAYWLAIGTMFYVMSLRRMESAILSVQERMLSAQRAQIALRNAQEEYNRAVLAFGPESRQARDAYERMIIAQKELELRQKAVIVAQDQLRATQTILALQIFPITINATVLFMQVLAALKPVIISYAQGTALAAAATALLKSSMIPIIGVAAGLATAMAIMAWFTAQYSRVTQDLSDSLYHRSLYDALIATTGATREFNRELSRIPREPVTTSIEMQIPNLDNFRAQVQNISRQIISIPTTVLTPEVPRPRIETVTIPARVQETAIRPRVEIPEVEIPTYRTTLQIQARMPTVEVPSLRTVLQVERPRIPEVEVPRVRIPVETVREQVIPVRTVYQRPEVPIPREAQIRIGYVVPRIPEMPRTLEQRIVQRTVPAPRIVPQDIVQNIRQNVVQARIPEIPTIQQNIVQRVQEARISSVPSLVQYIQQRLVPVRIPSISPLVQVVQQRLQQVRIPEIQPITQDIIQRLVAVRIPEIRDVTQTIRQTLVPTEIPPVVESIEQRIVQRAVLATIPRIAPEQIQTIRQQLVAVPIPQIQRTVEQRIVQRLERVRIPELVDQVQTIRQRLATVSIPRIQDQVQNIYQRLVRTEIPRIENVEQLITQRLVPAEVPTVDREQIQTIRQRLEPVRIPSVQDVTQIIFQRLVQTRIPQVPSQVQNIVQRVTIARIPEVPNRTQLIIQRLVPVEVPRIQSEQFQIIRQRLVPVRIPETRTQEQIIRQRLVPIRIPSYPETVQNIRQQLIPIRIPQVPMQIQTIEQRLQPVRIPETRSLTQTITQRLIPARIPEVRGAEQIVRQRIVPAILIQRVPEIVQRIRQQVLPVQFPRVGDIQYRVFPRVETARIPTITGIGRIQVTPILTQTRFTFPRHTVLVSPVLTGQPIVRPRIQPVGLEPLGVPVAFRTARGHVFFINIQFPNMVIRGPDDINQIAMSIEKIIVRESTLAGMRYA